MFGDAYEVLGISNDAIELEIKRAYNRKIKEFSNEKHPEQFKNIRRAYEILINEASRQKYDTMRTFGPEINRLEADAEHALSKKDLHSATLAYKKILMIEPSLHIYRNELALTLVQQGDLEKGLIQFEKLVTKYPENASYRCNYAHCLQKLGKTNEAVDSFKTAHHLDPNDVNIVFSLVELYIDNHDYEKARFTIESALEEKENEGFHRFYYLFKLIHVDIFERNTEQLERSLARVETLISAHIEESAYVANEFARLAFQLYEVKLYDWAKRLTERAIELDPENEYIQALHESNEENNVKSKEFQYLMDDERILKPVKHPFFLAFHKDEMSDEEFEQSLSIMYENVEYIAKFDPHETIKSLKRVLIKYPHLYESRQEFLEKIQGLANRSLEEQSQYEQLKHDHQVINALKRLIALYLSDVSEEERKHYFDDIIDELTYERTRAVYQSVTRIQSSYPLLYRLNESFFDELKRNAR
ncbi:tetratricopeptide repeat protein [Evansella cellulosilytica]|uniref:Heat shock protein DnaJ domain protein n=1 Tax=Evansella cellulosilytica (strain ATCC 21833 / DSM 2522 / FERM P-1141 / JCM 9156 / N-4) TaxID=649639 RepID=E6TT47_EVAC2|nr:tetratricopeptide repeat protein [Evansella cellulosilytica]ADU31955.1 heat shock protein DnaJ domain protein [Evansella cellulosilytica DSM 2522]